MTLCYNCVFNAWTQKVTIMRIVNGDIWGYMLKIHAKFSWTPDFRFSTNHFRASMLKPDRQWRSSSFQESKKVRVSCDLWPWPWPWPWAHPGCMLTWSPSCESSVAIRPFVCEKKRFAQKFTDGRTDRQTDDGRRAIALAHSWNELKKLTNQRTY